MDTVTSSVTLGLNYASQMGLPFGLSGLTIFGQAIAGFLRKKTLDKKQSDYLAPVLEEFESIIQEVLSEVDNTYSEIKKGALEQLDSIYNSQIELTLSAIKQAKKNSENEEMKSHEVAEYLNEVLSVIARLANSLEKYD